MCNLILYHLVSGHAWFSCGLLFLLVIGLDVAGCFVDHKRIAMFARLFLIALMLVAAASGTPVPLLMAIPLVWTPLAYLFLGFARPLKHERFIAGSIAGLLISIALLVEIPYHWVSPPRGPRPSRVIVIGDSLGAGMGRETITWPRMLEDLVPAPVTDLCLAGATVHTALAKPAQVLKETADTNSWVLLEIGGNDLLGDTSAEAFGRDLDQLLAIARGDPENLRTVLLLELPVIPGQWAFGAVQRDLARKHEVTLIPKHLLAGLILTEENVSDGVHLTETGHQRMAELMATWLR